jgi:hypothetical protein
MKYALMLTGLAAQHVAATWNFYDNFATPNYCKNECSDKQKTGFNWSDLQDGASVSQYGDFNFSGGWKCSNSFGKRDNLSKRTFGDKCIKNTVKKDQPASFGCDKRGFSVTHMDVSSEFDAELTLHYKMEDGSICKQHSSCSAGGSTIQNTQCGGAKSVDVYLGTHYTGGKDSCEIGFHNIGFDCNSQTSYTTPLPPKVSTTSSVVESSTLAIIKSTTPAVSSSAKTSAYSANTPVVSSSASKTPVSSAVVSSSSSKTNVSSAVQTPATSSVACGGYAGKACSISMAISSSVAFANSSSVAYHPSSAVISSVVKSSSTLTPEASTQSSAVVSSAVASSSAIKSSAAVSSSMAYSTATPVVSSSSASATPPATMPSYTPVNITDVVPKCMNSWLQISAQGCKDNTDSKCYCVKPEFTKNVIDCVTARCGSDDDTSKALQYFIGICADHVPQNPSIIDHCPSYIPLNPTPTPSAIVSSSKVAQSSAVVSSVAASSAAVSSAVVSSAVYSAAKPSSAAVSSAAQSSAVYSAVVPSSAAVSSAAQSSAVYSAVVPSSAAVSSAAVSSAAQSSAVYPAVVPSSAAAISSQVSEAATSSMVVPTTAAPTAPAAETTPCTTITYGTMTLTVPQVHFTTQTNEAGVAPTQPVALVPGTASVETPAATTGAYSGAPYPIPSSTADVPMGTATGTGAAYPSSTNAAQFTGAASALNIAPMGAGFLAVLAFFAL